MNIAAVFIAYFGIKETQFHPDTGAWREYYKITDHFHKDCTWTITI